jgi:hypothetical protein
MKKFAQTGGWLLAAGKIVGGFTEGWSMARAPWGCSILAIPGNVTMQQEMNLKTA